MSYDPWGDETYLDGCPRCLNDFREVLRDDQIERLEAGVALSRRSGVGHICWLCGKAEAVADLLRSPEDAEAFRQLEITARSIIQAEYELVRGGKAVVGSWVTRQECERRGRI